MTETVAVPAEQDENQRAFLRYLPKRIAAFEKRILRYRIDGWDPAGMAVLSGDVRRVADAGGHYGLTETRRNLLELAEMVSEHFATMRAPDPRQVKRMFALLSAATRSVAVYAESAPAVASVPAAAPIEAATAAPVAAPVDATPAIEDVAIVAAEPAPVESQLVPEPDAPAAQIESLESKVSVEAEPVASPEPVEPEETVETAESIVQLEPMASVETTEPVAAVEPVESVEPEMLVVQEEALEPVAATEPVASPETIEAHDPVEPVASIEAEEADPVAALILSVELTAAPEPDAPSAAIESTAPYALVESMEPDEADEADLPGEPGMRRIYHLSDGGALASELGQRLESEGYAIEPVASVEELSELLMCLMPQLLLVDASHVSELAAIGNLRREAQHRSMPHRRIQMVVMAELDTLETRRAAHRAEADLLLFAPFDQADLAARLQALHSTVAAEPVRVLIVEDNRADAMYAKTVLNRAGMQAYVEHDPMQVLEAIHVQRPDLVLMDLHMPFANGVEVTLLIREHPVFARLPIVFLSGESDPDSRLEAINAGGDDFLFKPIRPKHLICAVQDRVRRMHPVNK